MNQQEHQLLICMFMRMQATIGAMAEVLKREGLWSADDQKAYEYAIQSDQKQIGKYFFQAMTDYLECANRMGVLTGLEPPSIVP
jgi:hypothetical protein